MKTQKLVILATLILLSASSFSQSKGRHHSTVESHQKSNEGSNSKINTHKSGETSGKNFSSDDGVLLTIDKDLKNLENKVQTDLKKEEKIQQFDVNNIGAKEGEKIITTELNNNGEPNATQVTIKNSAGTARLDNLTKDFKMIEVKTGEAKLNKNQEKVYEAAKTEGAEVRGKKGESIGIPSGSKIPPSTVEIKRIN